MKNSDREFEEEWRKAFEQASDAPEEGSWEKINARLDHDELLHYKRKVGFYKLAVAASVLVLLAASLLLAAQQWLLVTPERQIVGSETTMPETFTTDPIVKSEEQGSAATYGRQAADVLDDAEGNLIPGTAGDQSSTARTGVAKSSDELIDDNDNALIAASTDGGEDKVEKEIDDTNISDSELLALENQVPHGEKYTEALNITSDEEENDTFAPGLSSGSVVLRKLQTKPDMPLLIDMNEGVPETEVYLIPMNRPSRKKDNVKLDDKFFAGLSFGSGRFNPNMQQGAMPIASSYTNFVGMAANNQRQQLQYAITNETETRAAAAYTYGANFGMRLGKRWLVQSGIMYASVNSTESSSTVLTSAGGGQYPTHFSTLNDINMQNASLQYSPGSDFRNNYEFASIPLKAGYYVLDGRMKVLLSAGVSSDMLLSNELSSDNAGLQTFTRSGENSPYNQFLLNGLTSGEIQYILGENYVLSLEPAFRIALSEFTKSEFAYTSRPQLWTVGAGIKYIFR